MEPLLYIGISQALFAAVLVFSQKPPRVENKILGLWLILIAIETSLILYYQTVEFSMDALNISIILKAAYMPIMFLYVNSLIMEKPDLLRQVVKHAIPFIVLFILIFSFRNEPLFFDPENSATSFIVNLSLIFWVYFLITIGLYAYFILKVLKEHQEKIKDRFSYTSEQVTLNWLKFVLVLFVVGFTMGLLALTIMEIYNNINIDARLFSRIALTIFTFVVSYYGIRQPSLNVSSPSETKSLTNPEPRTRTEKYQRSGLTDVMADKIQNDLDNYMISEKAYQNPQITINDIATHLDIPRHYITQVLNENLQKNFFTWINDYRIVDAKRKLKDKKNAHLTILAIAYDSGFNSKSSFNSIFKKTTGLTPSQFSQVQS
jgi:AraC-like DNA-binding protein